MSGIKIQTFGGKAPKIFARLLPDDMAQVATQVNLDAGRLDPRKGNATTSATFYASYSVSASTKTIFKYNNTWIGSNDDIDIIRSPIAEDPWDRIYITGATAGYPQMTNPTFIASSVYYRLGIPTPVDFASAPTLNPATSALAEEPTSVSYIYTYVSYFGEEGPPITAAVSHIVEKRSDQTVTVNFPTVVAPNGNITKKRLYRTDASGTFRVVDDVIGNSYLDSKPDSQLGEAISVSDHEAPPDGTASAHPDGQMIGLISLPNGITAGFTGNTVCFSEPFKPHAFPPGSRLTMKSDIVALAPMTNGVLVLTKEKPAMISGLDPRSMSMMEVDSTLSCVSKKSVVDMGSFVMYASPDGLVMATENGLQVITESILTRDQWQALVPTTINGFMYEGQYVGFYNDGSEQKGFLFDPRGGKNAYTKLDFHAIAGYNDLENDELYLVVGTSLVKFNTGSLANFTWKSKKYYSPKPANLAVGRVNCDSYSPNPTMKLYADGALKHTQTVTNGDLFPLPSGYKANEFEIQLEGSVAINEVCVYESAREAALA